MAEKLSLADRLLEIICDYSREKVESRVLIFNSSAAFKLKNLLESGIQELLSDSPLTTQIEIAKSEKKKIAPEVLTAQRLSIFEKIETEGIQKKARVSSETPAKQSSVVQVIIAFLLCLGCVKTIATWTQTFLLSPSILSFCALIVGIDKVSLYLFCLVAAIFSYATVLP
ncbi:MAG: hypothetical protein NZT61_02040 [Deltaproteobacteria bacterium]|nr:hypothetical protein [Deltaproteobacteria bacterium]